MAGLNLDLMPPFLGNGGGGESKAGSQRNCLHPRNKCTSAATLHMKNVPLINETKIGLFGD
jgi:hypothetical protein